MGAHNSACAALCSVMGLGVAVHGYAASESPSTLELSPIVVRATFNDWEEAPRTALGTVTQQTAAAISDLSHHQIDHTQTQLDELVADVPSMQVKTTDAGLTSAVTLRGFAVQKFYYNGLPDVQRMFVRDLATVEHTQIMRGSSGVASGINSAGGGVWFTGKRADFASHGSFSQTVGSDAWKRTVLDVNQALTENFAARLVAQWQDGQTDVGNLPKQRDDLLGALTWRYHPQGTLSIEMERQRNTQPYVFGTIIQNGAVRYSQLYASPEESSLRTMQRYALHWQHTAQPNPAHQVQWHLDVGRASMVRDESLIGFYTFKNATTLSGYYTQYHEDYTQDDLHARVRWQANTPILPHETQAGLTWQRRDMRFQGVQNIGGFNLNILNPDFSGVDVNTLKTTARARVEQSEERGYYLHHSIAPLPEIRLSAGWRHVQYDTWANGSGFTPKPAAIGDGRLMRYGLMLWPNAPLSPYLQYSQGLQPNSGFTRTGDFLAPQRSTLWEAGLKWQSPIRHGWLNTPWGGAAQVALFQIDLRNLAMTDPLDKTALVAAGAQRVQGLDLGGQLRLGRLTLAPTLQWLHTRNIEKISKTQGDRFVGVPSLQGSLRADIAFNQIDFSGQNLKPKYWLQLQGANAQYATPDNSLRLPGYSLWHTGLSLESGAWRLEASIRNLFNRDHVATVNNVDDVYQGAKRHYWLNLRGRW